MLKEDKSESEPAHLYGYGVFETIKVVGKNMLFFEEHIDRLLHGLFVIGLEHDLPLHILKEECNTLIDENNLQNGAIRITLGKGNICVKRTITCRENSYTKEMYLKGIPITISDIPRNEKSILVSVKSNNYLENLLILQNAKENGFKEAIFFNNRGYLAEGTMSNIFFIKDNIICTPAGDNGLLKGIIRSKIMGLLSELKITFEEGYYTKKDLEKAEEVFICNSLMDIMPVNKIDEIKYNIGNSITTKLMDKYQDIYYKRM